MPASSSGACKQYLRCEYMSFSGLAPLAPLECLSWVPALSLSAAVRSCGIGGAAIPRLCVISSLLLLAPLSLVAW